MDPNKLYCRYQELQQYVGWTAEDARLVQSIAGLLEPHLPALIDDFYTEIERHPRASKVITGGAEQVARLKGTLMNWLRELFSGRYDRDYVARRWRVGWRHVEIGLDQVYTNAALSRLRRGLLRALDHCWQGEHSTALAVRQALNTLLDLDLAIIEEAYQAEYTARQQHMERRLAEAEIGRLNQDLNQRARELQTLLDVIPLGIAIAQDPLCRRIDVNQALARMLRIPSGTRESLGVPCAERALQAAARGEEVRDVELEIQRPEGEAVTLCAYAAPLRDGHGQPRGAVGAFLDVTERKLAQERALQAERLAAIGQMVAGLAHESGNALARSQSCLEMLAWEVEGRSEALNLIARIQKAQDQLRQLYEEVRGYAAPLKLDREEWDLSVLWRQTWANLAVARQGRDATFTEELNGVDLRCWVDPFRMDQVFRNVLENALAACRDPVRIVVRASEASLNGRPAITLAIQDNGPGLTAEQRQRIFEPFYTTKTKGTGLGMAIVKRIVETHGGRITVGPSNFGAEILITLPRSPL